MTLKIIDEAYEGDGIYVGGYNIAPNVLLIRAQSFGDAWEAMIDEFGAAGSLGAPCGNERDDDCHLWRSLAADKDPGDYEICEGCEYGSSGGPWCTLDLVMRVVRPGKRD